MKTCVVLSALLLVSVGIVSADDSGPLDLVLLTDAAKESNAKCLDGSPGAYYWRKGSEPSKFVIYFEGGGWCASPNNCAARSYTNLGSSTAYPSSIPNTGYEGGQGYLSGLAHETAFSNFSVAYLKYCSGDSFSGRAEAPVPAGNVSLWMRGHYIKDAVLDDLMATKGLATATEVIISGCSAGGAACYIHCDALAARLSHAKVKCICDAGVFQDETSLVGEEDVMRDMFSYVVNTMNSSASLPEACLPRFPGDPTSCFFAQNILPTLTTPTFVINSMYNFFVREDNVHGWDACAPKNGGITPETYAQCNTTQKADIQAFHERFINHTAPAWDPSSPHGTFLTGCPNQHCETSTGWNIVTVKDTLMRDAVAQWYFGGKTVKIIDDPFPTNPTCGYTTHR